MRTSWSLLYCLLPALFVLSCGCACDGTSRPPAAAHPQSGLLIVKSLGSSHIGVFEPVSPWFHNAYAIVRHDESGPVYMRGTWHRPLVERPDDPHGGHFLPWRGVELRHFEIPLLLGVRLGMGMPVLSLGEYELGEASSPEVAAVRYQMTDGQIVEEVGFWSQEDATLYVPADPDVLKGIREQKPRVLGGIVILSPIGHIPTNGVQHLATKGTTPAYPQSPPR